VGTRFYPVLKGIRTNRNELISNFDPFELDKLEMIVALAVGVVLWLAEAPSIWWVDSLASASGCSNARQRLEWVCLTTTKNGLRSWSAKSKCSMRDCHDTRAEQREIYGSQIPDTPSFEIQGFARQLGQS